MQGVWSKSISAGALRRQTDRFAENTLQGERYDLRNAPLEQCRLHAPYVNSPGLTIARLMTSISRTLILTVSTLAAFSHAASIGTATVVSNDSEALFCQRLQAATVRIICGDDRSSGVIISVRGHVLTVAHGLRDGSDKVTIVFHDGSTTEAGILLKDTTADVAVLKIEPGENRVLFPIPVSADCGQFKNAVVFACGYPGRERNGLSPVVRLGEVLAVEPQALRSSCALTSGDSGGPLVNKRGELIGLNQRIGIGTESNLHLPLDCLRTAVMPVIDVSAIGKGSLPDAATNEAPLSITPPLPVACWKRTVELRYDAWHEVPVILGTLLSESLVATKLSEISPNVPVQCRLASGRACFASIIRSDPALDLAILKLADVQPNMPTLVFPERIPDAGSSNSHFRFVFAAHNADGVTRAGIVSRDTHTEPDLPCRFGAVLKGSRQAKAVIVTEIAPGSSAAGANLVPGEILRSLNGIAVSSLDQFDMILKKHQPGDWLTIESFRFPNQYSATVRLQHDPSEQFERTEFLDGRSGRVSERRSGFKSVLQHDIPILPEECGGPLCDATGQIIAMNIARRARESTLAVPIGDVLKLANRVQDPVDVND